MSDIKVYYRDGRIEEFKHVGRAGGSYTKKVRYELGWVIITDEWDKETAIPQELVLRVEKTEGRYW